MVEQFAAPPINPIISITPLSTTAPNRDSSGVPPALANLPPGTTLEGFVVNRDATNNPILRTSLGDLQMQSDVFVKTGSQMVIRVDATSDTRARIVTIDGLPPQDYAAQNTRGLTQDTIMTPQLLQRPTATAPGALPMEGKPLPLQAMLLASPAQSAPNPLFMQMPGASAPIPAALTKLQAGAALKVMILQMDLPSQIQSASSQPELPQSPLAPASTRTATPNPTPLNTPPATQPGIQQSSMASPQAARVAQQQYPLMPEANAPQLGRVPVMMPGQVTAKTIPSHLPSVPAAHPAELPKGIPALVIGHEGDGGNIVQTSFGMLKIYTPAPLPVHTKLTVQAEVETKPTPPQSLTPTTVSGGDSESLSTLSREWPHLTEALSLLAAQDPTGGRDTMQMLPHLGPKLTSGLIFFLAAVKGGDIRQWMGGRRFDQLELKMPELAAKLKGDMVQLQQLFLHSPLDQWSGVMLPMLHGDQLNFARLYVRNEAEDKGSKSSGGKSNEQRFVVDINLSHLGEMQFDGFVRQTQPKKQFDLMIRSSKTLDTTVANDIRALFETSLGATGYQGYLGFQQGSQHFVRPLAGKGGVDDRPLDSHTILA